MNYKQVLDAKQPFLECYCSNLFERPADRQRMCVGVCTCKHTCRFIHMQSPMCAHVGTDVITNTFFFTLQLSLENKVSR